MDLSHTKVQLNEALRERRVVESLQSDVQVLKQELARSEEIRDEQLRHIKKQEELLA